MPNAFNVISFVECLTEKFQDECTFVVSGEGFTWETQDRERDIAAAQAGWQRAKELIKDEKYQFVLLDESLNFGTQNEAF